MKKRMAWIPSGLLVASLIFSGCTNMNTDNPFLTEASESVESSVSETSESRTVQESSETASSSQVETSASTQRNMTSTTSDLHLDKAWLTAVTELYHKTHPDNDRFSDVYVDGIRGEGGYMPEFNNKFSFEYIASNGSQSFTLNIDPETEKASIDLDICYENSRLYTRGLPVGLDKIEAYVDALIDGAAQFEAAYDKSAYRTDAELLKHDLPILYARFIAFSDNAFPSLNTTLEDYGIDLGTKYRDFDLSQTLSSEVAIHNEHQFVDGVCADCGMTWTKYLNRTLATIEGVEIEGDPDRTEWFSQYGQNSKYGPDDWWYVQYSSSDIYRADLSYVYPNLTEFTSCRIYVNMEEDNYFSLSYRYNEQFSSDEADFPYAEYEYSIYVDDSLENFGKLFTSKEAFEEACDVLLELEWPDGEITYAWERMNEAEIQEAFQKGGRKYYSKKEILDEFWAQRENMLNAIDKGMIWYDTSFEDIGFNWK